MTRLTGSKYFPGGLGEHTVQAGHLEFELGPSEDITLQWASYYDAADEAGISRLYGGIHVAPDDGPGRVIGSEVGINAFELAEKYWNGAILIEPLDLSLSFDPVTKTATLEWPQERGMYYNLECSTDLGVSWFEGVTSTQALEDRGSFTDSFSALRKFYRIRRKTNK